MLRDLIDSGSFSVVELKKIFRQAGESDIVVNAHKINNGQEIPLDNKSRDFFFLERSDVQVCLLYTSLHAIGIIYFNGKRIGNAEFLQVNHGLPHTCLLYTSRCV